MSGHAFPSSAHPVDSSLLWLDGHLYTLNGEENIAAVSKDSKAEFLVQCHIQNVWLNRRKDEKQLLHDVEGSKVGRMAGKDKEGNPIFAL